MIQQTLLCCAMVCTITTFAQEENGQHQLTVSPLLEMVTNPENSSINFNQIDPPDELNFSTEFDLRRKTPDDRILLSARLQSDENIILSSEVHVIDEVNFELNGTSELRNQGVKTLIYKEDTLENCVLVQSSERNFLLYEQDTVIRYTNDFYSFIYENEIVLEVAKFERLWKGNLSQDFEGFSLNTLENQPDISLVLTPNVATSNCAANFDLYKAGEVSLSISNQTATVHRELYNGLLERGTNTIPFDVQTLAAGTYTVTLQFDNNTYSSQLLIQ